MNEIGSGSIPDFAKKNNFRMLLWIIIAFLIFGDIITTYYGVEFLGFIEQNSFMSVVIDNHAWQLLAVIKLEEFTFIYAIISFMDKFKDKFTYLFKTVFIALSFTILVGTLAINIGCLLGFC